MYYRRSILILHNTKTGDEYVLFAVVEQMRQGMQDYNENDYCRSAANTNSSKEWNVFAAIETIPSDDPFQDSPKHGKLNFANSLQQLPVDGGWINTACNGVVNKSIFNVIPKREAKPMVRLWLDNNQEMMGMLGGEERLQNLVRKACDMAFGINILDNSPEYIGAVLSLKYNSSLSSIDVTCSDKPKTGIYCRLKFWEDATNPLKLTVQNLDFEKNPLSIDVMTITPNDTYIFVQTQHPLHVMRLWVTEMDGTLVYLQNDVSFLHGISNGVGETDKSKEEELLTYLQERQEYREAEEDERNLKFIFFDGNPAHHEENTCRAKEVVARILNSAHQELYVCDPYFNADNFDDIITPLKFTHADIHIVNCKEQIDVQVDGNVYKTKKAKARKREQNYRELEKRKLSFKTNLEHCGQVEIHVMCGSSKLHDRMILTENQGWMIGSSFSELGHRACAIYKIPNNAFTVMKQQVQDWIEDNNTHTIREYIKDTYEKPIP